MKNINAFVASSVIAITSSSVLAQSTAVQWTTASGGNGHWYRVQPYGTITSWMSSQQDAVSHGGHLATLQDSGEEAYLRSIVGGGSCVGCAWSEFYIGAFQPDGSAEPMGGWEWVTGEPMNYSNWRAGEPNNSGGVEHFAAVNCVSGWNDGGNVAGCGNAAIIEWSADCNADGIVDYGQILSGQLIDANSNGIPDSCEIDPCPGDISGNNSVDGVDLAALLGMWGTSGQGKFDCDIDNDGLVGGSDLAVVLSDWGPCPN